MKDQETKMLKNPSLLRAAMSTLFAVNLFILWASVPTNAVHVTFLFGIGAAALLPIFGRRFLTKRLITATLGAIAMGTAGVVGHTLAEVDPCKPLVLMGCGLLCLGWFIAGKILERKGDNHAQEKGGRK